MSLLLKLFTFCIIFGIVYNVEVPCCISKRFQGTLKVLTASLPKGATQPIITENRMRLIHDRDYRMERINGTLYRNDGINESLTNYSMINDYRHERRYNFTETHCTIEAIHNEDMSNGCVPEGLAFAGVYSFGSGNYSVHVNAWEGDSGGFHWTYATAVDDCTPVSFTRFGIDTKGTRITENVLFSNVVQFTFSGSGVFDIPQLCKVSGNIVG